MTRRKPHTDAYKKRHPQPELERSHTVGYDRQRARHVMKQFIAQGRKRGGGVGATGTNVQRDGGPERTGADSQTEEGTVESA